jgi:hypothetical protein
MFVLSSMTVRGARLFFCRRRHTMPIRIDNSTVSDRAWGDVDKATLARRLAEDEQERAAIARYEEMIHMWETMPGRQGSRRTS